MSKLSVNNVRQSSPSWMVNVTTVLAVLTLIMPDLIEKLPGNVSQLTKEWLEWTLSLLTALSGLLTSFSKRSDLVGDRQKDD